MSPTLQNTRAQRNAALARSSVSGIGHLADTWAADQCPLLGVKRTCVGRREMSAFDPKRTLADER